MLPHSPQKELMPWAPWSWTWISSLERSIAADCPLCGALLCSLSKPAQKGCETCPPWVWRAGSTVPARWSLIAIEVNHRLARRLSLFHSALPSYLQQACWEGPFPTCCWLSSGRCFMQEAFPHEWIWLDEVIMSQGRAELPTDSSGGSAMAWHFSIMDFLQGHHARQLLSEWLCTGHLLWL